jgi:uncharacterized membrane protein YfcA
MTELPLLLSAAFGAGVLNTIAGGGTFLTFPALVFAGVPPVAANATSAVAVFPGYLSGALAYRRELRGLPRRALARLLALTLLGGLAGSLLLLVSSNEAFAAIVPFLLLAATLAFLFGDRIRAFAARHRGGVAPQGATGLLLVSAYGGYFNGGLGILLLALFALWGMTDIHRMNGLKTAASFALSGVSVATFAVAGLVHWPEALAMMLANTVGGYAGAPLARALPRPAVRAIVAAVGFGMSAAFFARLLG